MLKISKSIKYSKITLDFYNNNLIMYKLNNTNINWFYSCINTKKDTFDTRYIKRVNIKSNIKNDICNIKG